VSSSYPGLGAHELVPRPNLDTDAPLSPEDYFVLTRVDGKTSLRDLVLISGFPESQAVTILTRLRTAGAMLLPGDVAPPKRPKPAPPPPEPAPTTPFVAKPEPKPEPKIDESLLAEENDLSVEQRRIILVKHAAMFGATFFDVLEVPRDVEMRSLKRQYFRLSKDFHPDRFYGKRLGTYADKLSEIFDVMASAFEVLSDDAKRAAYEHELEHPAPPPEPLPARPAETPPQPQAPRRVVDPAKAVRLFEDACEHQVAGEVPRALGEFSLAIALDPQPRYLKRAAECALKAQELRSAEEYAKKLAELEPQNVLALRLLAKVLRAQGRSEEAEQASKKADMLDGGVQK
jgi:curved DNA-binding protein CbpA